MARIISQLMMIDLDSGLPPPVECVVADVAKAAFFLVGIDADLEINGDQTLSVVSFREVLVKVFSELFLLGRNDGSDVGMRNSLRMSLEYHSRGDVLVHWTIPAGQPDSAWLTGPLEQSLEIGTLHIRHMVVQQLSGLIEISRNVEGGWTFELGLPCVPRSY